MTLGDRREEEEHGLNSKTKKLRGKETLRRMVRETRMDKSSLIYPMFVTEGSQIKEEIPSMPGQ